MLRNNDFIFSRKNFCKVIGMANCHAHHKFCRIIRCAFASPSSPEDEYDENMKEESHQ